MDKPSISIVIPTYQRRALVAEALQALAHVEYDGGLEVIVVVDGSTDGTAESLINLDIGFPLRVITQVNAGAAAARNRGAKDAAGGVLLFLDDDMIADPRMVIEHVSSIRAGADAVVGDIPVHPGSLQGFLSQGLSQWVDERRQRLAAAAQVLPNDVLTGQLSIRRSVFLEIGGFDEAFTQDGAFGNEDTDLGIRLTERHHVVFNSLAISYQKYSVRPKAYLRQWSQAGAADVVLANKYPAHAKNLFRPGGRSASDRRLIVLAAKVPGLSYVISSAMGLIAALPIAQGGRLTRLLSRAFYMTRDLAYWRGVVRARETIRRSSVTVLCYHAIADLSDDPVLKDYAVPPEDFEAQLDGVIRRGFTIISGQDFADHLSGKRVLKPRSLLITFDDCYLDLLSEAAPRLMARDCHALAFAVSAIPSSTNEWDQAKGARQLQLLDKDGLLRTSQAHIEIGAHSRTHRPLTEIGVAELTSETDGAARDLSGLGLPRPRYFAYPYGRVNEAVREAISAASYKAAFALVPRRFRRGDDPLMVPRIEIVRRDGAVRFYLKTEFTEVYFWLAMLRHRLVQRLKRRRWAY